MLPSFPMSKAKLDFRTYDWDGYLPHHRAVLCFLRSPKRQVLLIHKKRGLGAGKVNAPGGKAEGAETLAQTAIRETQEEVGLTPVAPQHRGWLRFAFADGYLLEVHIFTATSWTGTLTETDEALPFWVREEDIPYDTMWQDDRFWLPDILSGFTVESEMFFSGDQMLFWDLRFSDGRRITGSVDDDGSSTPRVTPCPPTGRG